MNKGKGQKHNLAIKKMAQKRIKNDQNKQLILDKPVLPIAQTQQRTSAEKKENFVVPDQFPKHPAHPNLVLGSDLIAGVDHHPGILDHFFLLCELKDLVAKIDKGDSEGVLATLHHHQDDITKLIVVVKDVDRIVVDVHGC